MLVTIVRGGGLGGFVRRTELDSALLPPAAAARLRELVGALPWDPPQSVPSPDQLLYELTVVDDDLSRSVRTTDQSLAETERLLTVFVDGRPERVDSVDHL